MDRSWIKNFEDGAGAKAVIQFTSAPDKDKEGYYQRLVQSLLPLDESETVWASWAPSSPDNQKGGGILLFYLRDPPINNTYLRGLQFTEMPDGSPDWGLPAGVEH